MDENYREQARAHWRKRARECDLPISARPTEPVLAENWELPIIVPHPALDLDNPIKVEGAIAVERVFFEAGTHISTVLLIMSLKTGKNWLYDDETL